MLALKRIRTKFSLSNIRIQNIVTLCYEIPCIIISDTFLIFFPFWIKMSKHKTILQMSFDGWDVDMKYNLEKLFFLVDDNNPFSNLLKFARLFDFDNVSQDRKRSQTWQFFLSKNKSGCVHCKYIHCSAPKHFELQP